MRKNYDKLFDNRYWKIVKTDGKTLDQVFLDVEKLTHDIIERQKRNEMEVLWPEV